MMKKFLAFFLLLLLALVVSGCNLPQNGSTAVRQQPSPANPTATPSLGAMDLPGPAPEPTGTTSAPGPAPQPTGTASAAGATGATVAPSGSSRAPKTPTSTQTRTAGAYPSSPVEVVQAFVEAYPDQTEIMERYLSAAVRRALPGGGPGLLLKVQGDVTGFSVLSGSSIPNPPQAVVVAALEAGEARVERTFTLIRENGMWVINGIK